MNQNLRTLLLLLLGVSIIMYSVASTKRSNMPLIILRDRLDGDIRLMETYYDSVCVNYGSNSSQALSVMSQIQELEFNQGLVNAEIMGNYFVDCVMNIIGFCLILIAVYGGRDESPPA